MLLLVALKALAGDPALGERQPPELNAEAPALPTLDAVEHPVTFLVPHHFARAAARERIRQLLAYWHARFGITSQWNGDRVFMSGSIFGVDIRALLDVSDSCVRGTAADPGWLWRSPGTSYVEPKLKKYLHPTYDEPD